MAHDGVGSGWSVGPVVGVDRLELAVLDHGGENTSVEQLGLFDNSLNHLFAGNLELGLDKGDHGNVALDLNIFPQVQAIGGRAEALEANLAMLRAFDARLVAADTITIAQIDVQRRVDVRLQTPRHVVEAAVESDQAGADLAHAGNILDALLNLVPGAVELIGGGGARGGDGLVARHQRVEGDDLAVRVEDVEGELAGDEAGDGRNHRVRLLFAQHVG